MSIKNFNRNQLNLNLIVIKFKIKFKIGCAYTEIVCDIKEGKLFNFFNLKLYKSIKLKKHES